MGSAHQKKNQTMGTLVFIFEHLSQLSMDPRFKDPTLKIEVIVHFDAEARVEAGLVEPGLSRLGRADDV